MKFPFVRPQEETIRDEDDLTRFSALIPVLQIFVVLVGALLLLLCCYTICKFVVQQKKYKTVTISIFYFMAVLNLLCNIAYALIIPERNYCSWPWLVTRFGARYSSSILGICQASILTNL